MSKSDSYLTFPLAILNGENSDPNGSSLVATPLNCMELALYCGILGAGKGFRHHHGQDAYKARLEEVCDQLGMGKSSYPGPSTANGEVLVGAAICGVRLGNYDSSRLGRIADCAENVTKGGPLVRMKSAFFWAALKQARAESDPNTPWPARGISWREFRILAAILSAKINRAGFAFIGWEAIQARSCGYTTKEAFLKAETIPDHLAPALTHKMIRTTCDTLEALGFYARFHFSSGSRGGLMAYSFRHDRDELAKAVCDFVNFRDRAQIKANRADDAAKCSKLLERAKPGQSQTKGGGKASGKGGDKHNEKSLGEKFPLKNPERAMRALDPAGGEKSDSLKVTFENGNSNPSDAETETEDEPYDDW